MKIPDGEPIPCVGHDTRERWLIRDVSRADLEDYVNAACALGWSFAEAEIMQEAEPPLTPEIIRVWCHAELPKPRRKQTPKKPVPVEA